MEMCILAVKNWKWLLTSNYAISNNTQTKVKHHHIFFGDTALEVAERNMWVMEIKYFEFYCTFYYLYQHFDLKMILKSKYLNNSRSCTKEVKWFRKTMKKVCSRCLKNHFQLDFKQYGIISSRTSTSLLQILEKHKSLAYVFNFRCRFIARPPVLLQKEFSIDNSVRRLLLL